MELKCTNTDRWKHYQIVRSENESTVEWSTNPGNVQHMARHVVDV